MNAVEIDEAVSDLVAQPFDAVEFPFDFLAAFGNKDTTLKRLRSGSSNASDVPGGVLQRNNIHIAVAPAGAVDATLAALRESPKTGSAKAKFILATDGATLEAEDLLSGETVACDYVDLAQHFGFFLPLAGISTVKEIKNNPIDVKATGRLNKLYIELLKENPDWATEARRHALNQFMARLIFCFFAEDTGIFVPQQFTDTIKQMSDSQAYNTHEVLTELFRAMDMKKEERALQKVRNWADTFPYVNGGLFTGAADCPRFSRIARSYLLRVGELNWKEINPDIFGSMIQAVADDSERGELGMHYTSVPNILKVLNPLFLDDLREQLEAAGDNPRKLKNLRRRLHAIRVFDPACGSGNFLVIAYKEMRAIEAHIVRKLGDEEKRSVIPLSNFYGIEIKSFATEIARLALLIAEFQADCLYLSQQDARSMVLPLHKTGQIHIGNALLVNWFDVCPPMGNAVVEHDRGGMPGQIPVTSNGSESGVSGEAYICGNPPYKGSQDQTPQQKTDLEIAFSGRLKSTKSADYVAGWFIKARDYIASSNAAFAFVATNSINQGRQVALYWPAILGEDLEISFAVPSFPWRNLAAKAAVVTVSVVGVAKVSSRDKRLFIGDTVRLARHIGPYLVPDHKVIVDARKTPLSALSEMDFGSMPNDGGGLLLDSEEGDSLLARQNGISKFLRKFVGSDDALYGKYRYCVWVKDNEVDDAEAFPEIRRRIALVREHRLSSTREATKRLADRPHSFAEIRHKEAITLLVPRHSSEDRPYLPFDLVQPPVVVADSAIAMPNVALHEVGLFASRLHLVWIATVCGKLETRYRYSNTLGWNTFPVPKLTEQNKTDLARSGENILLAREAYFPASIADIYDPETMPDNLRRAHDANDEVLDRIYIGRRFRNDTERLEKLFELYTKMIANNPASSKKAHKAEARTT